MVKRIVLIVLLVASTAAIWRHADLIAKRTDFAQKQRKELERKIEEASGAVGEDISGSANELFDELYELVDENKDEIEDPESFEDQLTGIVNGLFSLDEKVYENDPELMGELTNQGFVTAAIEVVWDMVTEFDSNRVDAQQMEPGVTRLEDIPYIDDGTNEHMLDVFYPEGTDKPLPVIIDIHGGGLMMGDKDSNRVYCSVLAKRGYTVIAINYRLAPDVLYDSMVQDVMAAFKWVNDNGGKYYCDLDNVFVTGESAGGQLAYYVPLVNTSEELMQLYNVEPSGLDIKAIGLVSGMYDLKNGLNGSLISCYLGFDYKNSPYYDYIQPEEALPLGELPPAYIVTSQRDFLHASGVYFDEVLTEQGVEHQFRDWGMTLNKSSGHITSVAYPELEESQQTIDEMLAFFEAHMSK